MLEPVHTDTASTSPIITYPGSKIDVGEDREDSCETLKEPL